MSLSTTLTNGVRSATYNPEAERAFEEDRKKANSIKQKIRAATTKAQDDLAKIAANPNSPQASVKEIQKLIDGINTYSTSNPDAPSTEVEDKFQQFTDALKNATDKLNILVQFQSVVQYYNATIEDATSKKQINTAKKTALDAKANESKGILAASQKQTSNDVKLAYEKWNNEMVALFQDAGIQVDASKNPTQLQKEAKEKEKLLKERQENENKKFSLSRFVGRVQATATTVVSSLLYIMLCLVMGMIAANDAIGREPMYRVLYFIYGAIFAPFLLFYYLYRWYKGTSPKIYTLIPYTQSQAETSLGRFVLFPFYYKEDKVARDLMVEFLSQSAEAVGKTFDPATLGTLGNHAEKALENMKKLSADAAETTAVATTAPANAVLPNVSKLKVNA